MIRIDLISVGKLKEKYLKQGIEEYNKRLTSYAKVNLVELEDEPTKEAMSEVEIKQVLDREAERIVKRLDPGSKVIVLAIEGDLLSSEDLADKIKTYATYGDSKLTFIIGGSLGLADAIKKKADVTLSFGRITLPHQLMRLVLMEQIYRAFRINEGHAYHK